MNTIQSKNEDGEALPEIEMDIDLFRDMLRDVGESNEITIHLLYIAFKEGDYTFLGELVEACIENNFEEYKERCK